MQALGLRHCDEFSKRIPQARHPGRRANLWVLVASSLESYVLLDPLAIHFTSQSCSMAPYQSVEALRLTTVTLSCLNISKTIAILVAPVEFKEKGSLSGLPCRQAEMKEHHAFLEHCRLQNHPMLLLTAGWAGRTALTMHDSKAQKPSLAIFI